MVAILLLFMLLIPFLVSIDFGIVGSGAQRPDPGAGSRLR
jgi:hypothetical protein